MKGGNHLYIMQMAHTGAIKIGRSSCPEKRRSQIQTSCPYRVKIILVIEDHGCIERRLHKDLRRYRTAKFHGEWFRESGLAELPIWVYERLNVDDMDWWQDEPAKEGGLEL